MPLLPVSLVSPGSWGLNTERSNALLDFRWSTIASNMVVNRNGRLAARNGWSNQSTASVISGSHPIDALFEWIDETGAVVMISAANDKIYKDVDDYTDSGNDITPSGAPTADNWQFRNFNGQVVGFQVGHTPIEYTGTGDFTVITQTSGTLPDSPCFASAFGRIWAVDADLQTIRICKLLDNTRWSTADGGHSIDMRNVWTNGMDEVVAIEAFGSNIVVFGRNHIIIYGDEQGNEVGVDPSNMVIVDTIEGTGCIARDSVQSVGESDIAFLSRHGVQLLGRVISEKSNPIVSVTDNIRTDMQAAISTPLTIRSVYSPENGFYLLSIPATSLVVCIDFRHSFVDERGDAGFPVTKWAMTDTPTAFSSRQNGDLLMGMVSRVGLYTLKQDNATAYNVEFMGAWLDLEDKNELLKILKDMPTVMQVDGSPAVVFKWEYDWSGESFSTTVQYTGVTGSEWNAAKWNEDEFGGALKIQKKIIDGQGEGQYFRVGLSTTIDATDIIIQHIRPMFKVGRMA